MINKNAFIAAVKILHSAMHGIERPKDDGEYEIIKSLFEGYLFLLSNMNPVLGGKIQEFIILNPEPTDEEYEDLYLILSGLPSEYES